MNNRVIIDPLILTPEQLETVESMGGLMYSVDDVALFLGVDSVVLQAAINDEDSEVSWCYRRGRLVADASINLQLLEKAKGGDLQAFQAVRDIRRDKSFETSKLDVYGAFDDKKLISKLQDYVLNNDASKLNPKEAFYVDCMMLIASLDHKSGKRNTVKFLTTHFGLTYQKASDLYNESVNLFYSGRSITQKSLRNKYAECLEQAAAMALAAAKTSRDFESYGKLITQAAAVRNLDKDEPEPLDNAVYRKNVTIFSLDTEHLGLSANRLEVAQVIDSLNLPEADKERFRRDALINNINIDILLNDSKEASQTEQ